MANIRIITWDQKELDYISPETLNLKLNRIVDDLINPSNRFGEYSFTFSLPMTNNNMAIFSYAGTQNITNNFKYNTIECSIYDDDKLIIEGILELRAIKDNYECVMYSKFTQLIDNLQDKKLQDIQSLPHIVGFDYENTIIDHINADYANSDEAKWQFPFIYYNTFYTPTGVFTGTTDQTGRDFRADTNKQNYYNLINNTTNPTPNEFYFHQFPLAWYIVPVLEGMLQDAGWTLGGSFFEDKNVKKIIMPYVGESDVYDTASYCTDIVITPTIVIPAEVPNVPLTYSISIIKSGSLLGNVYGYGTFDSGTIVNLTASPLAGNEFINWKFCNSDVVLSTNPSLTMIADADYCIEATFREICVAPTTTIYVPTTTVFIPTTTIYIPTTTVYDPNGFITEWTVAGDTTARTITLPLVSGSTDGILNYNCTVYWGDGTSSSITTYNDTRRIHTYASDGTYQVNIVGTMEGWSINNNSDKLKITKVINFGGASFNGFKYLSLGFYGCTNLTSLGTNPIKASGTGILSNGFFATFQKTSITSIPVGLFDQHTSLTTNAFWGTFATCPYITSIPIDLFRYNTLVNGNNEFRDTFNGTGITSIPEDLFRYNTLVSGSLAFYQTFANSNNLTTIPSNLFKYNVNVTAINSTFVSGIGNSSLLTIGEGLFRYNILCTTFISVFLNSTKLQLNKYIFYAEGEQNTRFLNKSVSFQSTFSRTLFTGTIGTAPDLWNCNFGTGTPIKTSCFTGAGNSTTSLTNYASIPNDWK